MISIEARGKFAVFQSGKLVKITLGERERERELCSTSIRVGRERFFFLLSFFRFSSNFYTNFVRGKGETFEDGNECFNERFVALGMMERRKEESVKNCSIEMLFYSH